ncbi:TPA: hemagglutinin repeat-containing protein [Neisseria lactamica]
MNKQCYKVIFNKKRSCMMAVAENVHRDGKSMQDSEAASVRVTGAASVSSARAAFGFRMAAFSVMLALGVAAFSPAPASGIIADKSAPKNQQAVILQTANGLPQVNIQTPSSQGVSVNRFKQFDVDEKGAILNNSRSNTQTQLGGWIQGNPYLARGEARVIVNQIDSSSPSLLNGYIEVGGKRAEVVVANPSGIRVNGGGLINAASVTLTSGVPVLNNGNLTGFDVSSGKVVIRDKGLDTSDADYTRILSRAAEINAGVWGKDVKVVSGKNKLDFDGSLAETASAPSSSDSVTPTVAIDTAALGGMYADKITLISTDNGAVIRNKGRIFAAAGGVTLSADGKLSNSGSIDAAEIAIAAQTVDNRQGFIRSGKGSVLKVSDGINNQAGLIGSAGLLDIHDTGKSSLHINNTDGTIIAGKDVSLQAKSLDNDGILTAARDVSISLHDDFAGKRDIEAGRTLTFSTQGRLKNTRIIQAGDTVSLTAAQIDNTVSGKIQSGNRTGLNGKNGITNRGLINSNGITLLQTGAKSDNAGTGRIYGSRVAVEADTLLNREETVNGETKAAVIAARERLDIGAREIENREAALLSSSGDLHIGSALNGGRQAQGANTSLHNRSAAIESSGNIRIATKDLQNTNEHLRFHTEETHREHRIEYQAEGRTERYLEGSQKESGWEIFEDESLHMRTPDGIPHSVWYKYDYERITAESKITESKPGQIISGGNLVLDAAKLKNHNSRIIAGGRLIVGTPESALDNDETLGTKTITDKGDLHRYHRHHKKGRDSTGHSRSPYEPAPEVSSIRMGISAYKGYAPQQASDISGTVVPAVAENGIHPTFTLPNSSLFAIAPNNKGYLIETDPAFTDYRKWLGSGYMLAALQQDPNHIHKRLGDGYYEQKLVNEQISKLTGYRRLDGYTNDEEQFKALMDNGITIAKELQLTPGIALSAEQVARLTSDIVWLENETVTLPDGTTQTVLKPKVYIRARPQDMNGQGALLSGGVVDIGSGAIENRGGLIAGREALILNAQNIKNLQGDLQGKNIFAAAGGDITNTGSIGAVNALLLKAGGNIESRSETRSNQNKQGSVRNIGRVAGIYLTGRQNGSVLLDAGNNIVLTASELTNQSEDGQTVLNAGGDIRLDTTGISRNQNTIFDSDNYVIRKEQNEVGSTIRTRGNLSLNAQEDIRIRAAEVGSEQGRLKLAVGRDIKVEAGKAHTETEDALKYTGRSGGGIKQKMTRHLKNQNGQTVSGTLDGKEIILVSGRDITVTGSNIIADNHTILSAKNNIVLKAAETRSRSAEMNKKEKSGLMGSGGIGFTSGSKKDTQTNRSETVSHTESVVGSLNGNTLISAGKHYTQTGSTVSSPQGDVGISSGKISIDAAQNRYSQESKQVYEQKGVTVAINVPVVNTVMGAVDAVKAVQTLGKSKNSRVNAMAAANALNKGIDSGVALYNAARNPKEAAGQGISVSITYGEQKNISESRIKGTQVQEGKITGGGKVSLTASGAGKDSDITIAGSDVYGGRGTLLKAENAVQIEAARQTHQERSENKSAGFNAGVAIAINKGISFGFTAGANYGKGYGNGDETAYRNSHIGSKDSQTAIESGGDTVIKGGQLKGKGVGVTAESLHIESLQDTAVFKGKQENVSAQVTVGYGFSAGGSYNRSKSSSDYASVNEQSGIFAGGDGYRVRVNGKTGDDELNEKYRSERIEKGETFKEANLNQNNAGGLKFGLKQNDIHSNDKYALAKMGLGNLLGNAKESESRQSITRSVISEGDWQIASAQGRKNIAGIEKGTSSAHKALAKADREGLLKEVELNRDIAKEFVNETLIGGIADEAYRSQFIAEHRLMTFKMDENGKPIEDKQLEEDMKKQFDQSSKLKKEFASSTDYWEAYKAMGGNIYELREVSDQERKNLKTARYTDPETGKTVEKIVVGVNGIFNNIQAAAKFAAQQYVGRFNPEKNRYERTYENVYFLHNPETNGRGFSKLPEIAVAAFHKMLEGAKIGNKTIIGLGNSGLALGNIMEDYGKDKNGLFVGSHSRGTLVVDNVLKTLNTRANRDKKILSNTELKMVGPATNVARADKRLFQLQQGVTTPRTADFARQSIQIENHELDLIGMLIGRNPATVGTNTRQKSQWQAIRDIIGDYTSPHNCYGMGNDRCVEDGYRDPENKQTQSPTGVFERGVSNEIKIMYPPIRIYDLQHPKGKTK